MGTLEDDQCRRDFTINVLALCLNGKHFGELVDPFGGVDDLREKIIRTPLDPDITFSDDPLRMMRCVRFASQLGFYIYDETFDALERNAERIKIVSQERIIDELNKIILSPHPSKGLVDLQRAGLLQYILPEVSDLDLQETRGKFSHKNNFYHTLEVLENVAANSNKLWLRWAALLHDIGMKYVQKLVDLHMRPIAIADSEVTDSAVRRLLFDAGDDIEDLMTLCEADITSRNRQRKQTFLDNFKLVRRRLKEIEERDRIRNFQPPVDGNEIMETFGLKPCREVGILKALVKDAVLDGVVPNDHDLVFEYMLGKAKEMGLVPIKQK